VAPEYKESKLAELLKFELHLFHMQHATMNMVKAKIAPTIVQQQSVIFLDFSCAGSCSGKITFSSNIVVDD
jgi:hypothetical protein